MIVRFSKANLKLECYILNTLSIGVEEKKTFMLHKNKDNFQNVISYFSKLTREEKCGKHKDKKSSKKSNDKERFYL